MKKVKIANKIYEVTNIDNYRKNSDIYNPAYTAIEVDDQVLPVLNRPDEERTGIYIDNEFSNIISCINILPDDNIEDYSSSNIIDFNKLSNINEIFETQQYVKDLENEIIVNSDNIFEPRIDDLDSPEMRALKEAVRAKKIDINAYAPRFEGNFANHKRLFNDNKITLNKLKIIADALDIKCTLTMEDTSSSIANPIGKTISVNISGGGDDIE